MTQSGRGMRDGRGTERGDTETAERKARCMGWGAVTGARSGGVQAGGGGWRGEATGVVKKKEGGRARKSRCSKPGISPVTKLNADLL